MPSHQSQWIIIIMSDNNCYVKLSIGVVMKKNSFGNSEANAKEWASAFA